MMGSMSGVQGRTPIQGSARRDPSGRSSRATGSSSPSWTGVAGASMREFDAGGEPDAGAHRRQQEATLRSENSAVQRKGRHA